jgi:hypothetical protein
MDLFILETNHQLLITPRLTSLAQSPKLMADR